MIWIFTSRSLSIKSQEKQDWNRSRGVRVVCLFVCLFSMGEMNIINCDGDSEKTITLSHVMALLLSLKLKMNK